MTEQLLDGSNINAGIQHVGRVAVPETVTRHAFTDAGFHRSDPQ